MKTEKIISWILLVVMIAAAFLFGAYRGWKSEYEAVEAGRADLLSAYTVRKETARNVLTVAERYLQKGDEALEKVRADWTALSAKNAPLSAMAGATAALQGDADMLLEKLRELPALQADDRDSMYAATLLPQMLDTTAQAVQTAENTYRGIADEYNDRFHRFYISSFLAGLFGYRTAETLD